MYEKIFSMACEELPHKHFVFDNEEVVMYRGFKISLKDGDFYWQDTRNSNFYEPVDPLITKNILQSGFIDTLTHVTIHNDEDKMCRIDREIFDINRQITYWTTESTDNWITFKKQQAGILLNLKLTQEQIEYKIIALNKKYYHKKNLYIKKRGVLKQERLELEAEMAFYLSRIKLYKNRNYGS